MPQLNLATIFKKILFSLIVFASLSNIYAQTIPSVQWQKTLGGTGDDGLNRIQQTDDGGYIVGGYSTSNNGDLTGNHGGKDFWIIKLDANRVIQWQKSLGGSGDDGLNRVQQTFDKGYILAGYSTSNDGNVSGNHGGYDSWIVKLDSAGNLKWQKSLGGSTNDYATSIRQTSDTGYIFVGNTDSNDGNVSGNHGGIDYWVVKLDSLGNIKWQKALGGSGTDVASSVTQNADGSYVLVGFSNSNNGNVSGNHGANDI